jgi:hypothetical protein
MRLVFAPRDEPPFPVQAIVEEEDTYQSLSAEAVLRLSGEHPLRVLSAAHAAEEATPGDVVVRPGQPLRLLAIVHKLDEDPTWRDAWVETALENVVTECERRRLVSLGLPLLGTVHGKLPLSRALELTRWTLRRAATLERVWVVR